MSQIDSVNEGFKFLIDFGIKVPSSYSHYRHFLDFRERFGESEKLYRMEAGFNDECLNRASYRLRPGRHCLVEVFQVSRRVSSDEALHFVCGRGAHLVGGQGAALLWPQAKDLIPPMRRVVSLDIPGNLPKVDIVRRWNGPYTVEKRVGVPYVFLYSGNDVGFHFDPIDEGFDERHCVACFKQEK